MTSFALADKSMDGKLDRGEICDVLERAKRMSIRAAKPGQRVWWLSLSDKKKCKETAERILEGADENDVCATPSTERASMAAAGCDPVLC